MAKSINEWYDIITAQFVSGMATAGVDVDPTTWSITDHRRIFIYAIAVCVATPGIIFDIFRIEIDETISLMKPHSTRWYAEKAKAFQYGYNLFTESDYYDNTGIPAATIAASKIISYAAVVEQIRGIRIKVAKTSGSDLAALDSGELASFSDYMKKIKDAGVKLAITSGPADSLRSVLTIIYNPLVLNNVGARIDGITATPVQDAIRLHLKNLPFNGVFSVQSFVDAIQAVEGVVDLNVNEIQSKYGALLFTTINISVIPDSGYLRIEDTDLIITFQPAA